MPITLITGCMYSGKSSELDKTLHRYASIGLKVVKIEYNIERCEVERWHQDLFEKEKGGSSDFKKVKCTELDSALFSDYEVVGIDEAHFFSGLVEFCTSLASRKISVLVCGLNGDRYRKPFTGLTDLIPYVDDIQFKTALCSLCKDGTQGIFSMMHVNDTYGSVEVVGGADKYKPVCRVCYERETTYCLHSSSALSTS